MTRIASIDIGTNTALLLIADCSPDFEIKPVYEEEQIVRLGEGVDENKRVRSEAIERVVNAVHKYKKICGDYQTETILMTGTSAVRDARNQHELLGKIRDRCHLELTVLTGEAEARLTYLGAVSDKSDLETPILVIDIGGGSTELIMGNHSTVSQMISFDIGSVRLTERVLRSDPVTDKEMRRLQEIIQNTLAKVAFNKLTFGTVVGVAGTVTTLACMQLGLHEYDPQKINQTRLTTRDIRTIINSLKIKTLAERRKIVGLNPKRADVILAGAVILEECMTYFKATELRVSDRGLRYGVILNYFMNKER